jgi:hypothetical protein
MMLLIALFAACCFAQAPGEKITSLPGYSSYVAFFSFVLFVF